MKTLEELRDLVKSAILSLSDEEIQLVGPAWHLVEATEIDANTAVAIVLQGKAAVQS